MTAAERKEHNKLSRLWATKRATTAQIKRCMELDRQAERTTNIRARLKSSGLY